MNLMDALILGAVQGVSEFLPISSSGHLVLGEHFLGLNVADLKAFDVVVHVGTLLAILVYFWQDVWGMLRAFGRFLTGQIDKGDEYGRLIVFILIGTMPAVVVGLWGGDIIDGAFRNVDAVLLWMLFAAVMFVIAELVFTRFWKKKDQGLNLWRAIIIGLMQALALIPGVSRSGITISAGLLQGVEREKAARFSFLLGIPAIAGAGLLTALKSGGDLGVGGVELLAGFLSAFLFGVLSVAFLMKFLKKHSLVVFAVYLAGLFVLNQVLGLF